VWRMPPVTPRSGVTSNATRPRDGIVSGPLSARESICARPRRLTSAMAASYFASVSSHALGLRPSSSNSAGELLACSPVDHGRRVRIILPRRRPRKSPAEQISPRESARRNKAARRERRTALARDGSARVPAGLHRPLRRRTSFGARRARVRLSPPRLLCASASFSSLARRRCLRREPILPRPAHRGKRPGGSARACPQESCVVHRDSQEFTVSTVMRAARPKAERDGFSGTLNPLSRRGTPRRRRGGWRVPRRFPPA
jgi:hypothetical protein